MKRRISIDQLNELTDKQKHKLKEMWIPCKGEDRECFYVNAYKFIYNYKPNMVPLKGASDRLWLNIKSDVLKLT